MSLPRWSGSGQCIATASRQPPRLATPTSRWESGADWRDGSERIYARTAMPQPDFFARFGLFVKREFLDPATRADIRREMEAASGFSATISTRGETPTDELDEDYRRTKMAEVSDATERLVEERLNGLRPELQQHFSVELTSLQPPQFLFYKEGDFFRPHPDNASGPDAAEAVKARRVSLVIFLNGEGSESDPDSYGGGALTFYGLLGADPRGESIAFPMTGVGGLLVAFPSDLIHG